MKRLILSGLILSFLLAFPILIYAASGSSDWEEDDINYNFDKYNNYTYSVTASKWVSGNRYQTEALVIQKWEQSNGIPMTGQAGQDWIVIPVYPNNNNPVRGSVTLSEVLRGDEGQAWYRSGASCVDSIEGGSVSTRCSIDRLIIEQAMYQLFGDSLQSDQTVYISHLFQVSGTNGVLENLDLSNVSHRNKLVTTRSSMLSAANWSPGTINAIPDYYNKPAVYAPMNWLMRVYVEEGSELDLNSLKDFMNEADTQWSVIQRLMSVPGVITVTPFNRDNVDDDYHRSKWPVRMKLPLIDLHEKYFTWELQGSYYWDSRGNNGPTGRRAEVGPNVLARDLTMGAGHTIVVAEYKQPDEITEGCEGGCPAVCTVSGGTSGTLASSSSWMNFAGSGSLLADTKANPKFDVSKGIPTGEKTYSENQAKQWLLDYNFEQFSGECKWEVSVSKVFKLSWTIIEGSSTCRDWNAEGTSCDRYHDSTGSGTETAKETVTVTRPFSFWMVKDLGLYRLNGVDVSSKVLPGGKASIASTGNVVTGIVNSEANHASHYQVNKVNAITLAEGKVSGGNSRPSVPSIKTDATNAAESAVDSSGGVKVRNDQVVLFGNTVISNEWVQSDGASPRNLPTNHPTGTMMQSGYTIPTSISDGVYPTTAQARYARVVYKDASKHPSARVYDYNPNSVTVHTPVVNYSSFSNNNSDFNQYWGSMGGRTSVVLGRDLILNFPDSGQHKPILGYGDRNYSAYVGEKRVRFPFAVYIGSSFYPANTWIKVTRESLTFTIPEFVKEGDYTIRTEVWAQNAQSFNTCGIGYNGTLGQECAVQTHDVKVVGRMYGFTVYDIGDFRFEKVFREKVGSTKWSGFSYWSGLSDHNGNTHAASSKPQLSLPIRPGSHPSEIATTPHNGYPFLFYFTTVGEYWEKDSGMRIVPTFYFVPKAGGDPVEVDLYYNTTTAKFIKVGSANDKGFNRSIVMDGPIRAIDSNILRESIGFEYDNLVSSPLSKSDYISANLKRPISIATGYKNMTLDYRTRTLIGQVDSSISVSNSVQRSAKQRWFGEYSLPIDPYILKAGTNLEELTRTKYKGSITGKESEFLKSGYIIVNFQIYAYKNGNSGAASLAYDASSQGNSNMWDIEKQVRSSTSYLGSNFKYKFGDIIMFESDFSVKDDYK